MAQLKANNSYVVREAAPPAGYEALAGEFTLTVDADGAIAVGTLPQAYEVDATATDELTIVATDEPIEMQLVKVSANDGTPLADAVFTIEADRRLRVCERLHRRQDACRLRCKRRRLDRLGLARCWQQLRGERGYGPRPVTSWLIPSPSRWARTAP